MLHNLMFLSKPFILRSQAQLTAEFQMVHLGHRFGSLRFLSVAFPCFIQQPKYFPVQACMDFHG